MSIEPTSTIRVDVLAGHLGHLTESQKTAFATFQENLAKAQLYSPPQGQDEGGIISRPSHDEPTLLVALYEVMCRFVLPLCTYLPHRTAPTPISSVTTIIDLEQVTITSLWNWRRHLQEASTLATANYPETLSTIVVVNSPSFFPTAWSWIKPWFDEGTRNKVYVLGKDPGPTLRTLIDSRDLPKPYGGELDWKYEDEPFLDDAATEAIGSMPKGPAVFIDGKVEQAPSGSTSR
ncbi:hypothetical protein PHLCEN_2v1126 [Hermanssonia centrifuga]|uniref:CRAL-TRIO domain-containing protein n=1 Tax=Hermanssonia centrifuga TaxID=98765 RepID=A0A2R6S475_9APHY|nr:hypothetical protein PHLCEN_2v1126 [Hermanssonia centrifuga]